MTKTTTASRLVGWTVSTATLGAICLTGYPSNRLTAQSVDSLALRFSAMTAVTGYEQAMADSLVALLPGSARDRAGNVTLTLGRRAPRRLVSCPLDEVGYVVGNVMDDGYLTLRRVGARVTDLKDLVSLGDLVRAIAEDW